MDTNMDPDLDPDMEIDMETPVMKTVMNAVARYQAEVEEMVAEFAKFRETWSEHITWIEKDTERMSKQYPIQIKRNIFATQHAISQALDRLTAFDKQLTTREAALTDRRIPSVHSPVPEIMAEMMRRSPVSSESRAWQFISAVVNVEDFLKSYHCFLEIREQALTRHLIQLEGYHKKVTSSVMPLICVLRETIDHNETQLIEDSDLSDAERHAHKGYLDMMWGLLRELNDVDVRIHHFKYLLSGVGVKMARQRLVTEFFKKQSKA
jgi:hypothetical protein